MLPLHVSGPLYTYELLSLWGHNDNYTELRVSLGKKRRFSQLRLERGGLLRTSCARSLSKVSPSPKVLCCCNIECDVCVSLLTFAPSKSKRGLSVNNIIRLHLHTRNSARFLLRQVANRETLCGCECVIWSPTAVYRITRSAISYNIISSWLSAAATKVHDSVHPCASSFLIFNRRICYLAYAAAAQFLLFWKQSAKKCGNNYFASNFTTERVAI